MLIFEQPRRSGKTTSIVEWVKHGKPTNQYPFFTRVMLVHDEREAKRVRGQFCLDDNQVFSYDQWTKKYMRCDVEVAIDNLDMLLTYLFGNVRLATLTEE